MAKTMIAPEDQMTDGQIDNIVDKLRAAMRKHRSEVHKDIGNRLTGLRNLGMELYAPIRAHVEVLSNLIIRTVLVDYDLSPEELLALAKQSGRTPYVDPTVLATMPRPAGMFGKQEVEARVFKPRFASHQNGLITDTALQEEYRFHGVTPDPWLAFALNVADSAFADQNPNGAPWLDADGHYCYAGFYWWNDGRRVGVSRSGGPWDDYWKFVGRCE